MTTIKKTCPACMGHGGVWGGSLPNATQCDMCDGRGNLLLNVCPECERWFLMSDETDSNEWHYGHDCEP